MSVVFEFLGELVMELLIDPAFDAKTPRLNRWWLAASLLTCGLFIALGGVLLWLGWRMLWAWPVAGLLIGGFGGFFGRSVRRYKRATRAH